MVPEWVTRIDLFRSRSGSGWSTQYAVTRWRREGEGPWEEVTPGDHPGLPRQGGFPEALHAARRLAWPGETVRVRLHRRDKRQRWRVVNSYPVQLPRERKRVGS